MRFDIEENFLDDQSNGWNVQSSEKFTSNHDPDPVMASRKQHEQRLYRLEFKIQTYQYPLQ